MTDEQGHLLDGYGYSADNPRWRDINDTGVYIGDVNGLYMYTKMIDGHPVDCMGCAQYHPCQNYKQYCERMKEMLLSGQ